MLKFLIISLCIFTLFGEEPINEDGPPIRRTPAMQTRAEELSVLTSNFAEKLVTMVVCYHENRCYEELGKHQITLRKILNLINQNPENANPYVARYDAHLITLASRWGLFEIMKAIAYSNQQSIYCQDKEGRTPLDEAIIFKNISTAQFLHQLQAPQFHTTQEQYKNLCSRNIRISR